MGGDLDGDGLGDTLLPYNSQGNIQNGGDMHPLTNIILPGSFIVQSGILVSGTLQDLFASDDSYVIVRVSPAAELMVPIQIIVKGTSPIPTPTELRFKVESSVVGPSSAEQRIDLFNYQTNRWEEVDRRYRTYSDSVTEVVISTSPERFVNPVTKEMRARVGYREISSEVYSWRARLDQTVWRIAG